MTRLLVDVAFGIGGLQENYGLRTAELDGKPVVLLAELTEEGWVPLAEIHPVRDGYVNPPEEGNNG